MFDSIEVWDEPRILAATASGHESVAANALADSLRDASIAAGFAPVRPFTRMLRDGPAEQGSPATIFAIAGPELG